MHIIADNILITGEGDKQEEEDKDHDKNLRCFLIRCIQRDIKLDADKFKLRRESVPYIGHFLTAPGLSIDPEKVWEIQELMRPTDVKVYRDL